MRRNYTKLAAIAAMMGLIAPGTARAMAGTNQGQSVTRDAVTQSDKRPTVQQEIKMMTGNSGWFGRPEGRFLNQRQYRKKCRQNPSLYKSKKHRSKN